MSAGAIVLTGWALKFDALKGVVPGWIVVKPNTALALVLTGIALLSSGQAKSRGVLLASLCAFLVGAIGLLTLGEYVFAWNPGFDQWLFREPAGAIATSHPGRMAPDTALCFALLAASLRVRRTRWALHRSVIGGSLVASVALIAIMASLTPSLRAQGWWGLTVMAPSTAVVFGGLGVALVVDGWREISARSKWVFGFAGLTLLLLATGWWYYRAEWNFVRQGKYAELAGIGDLKAGQIQQWRHERLGDAMRITSVSFMRRSVTEYRRDPHGPIRADLRERLNIEQTTGNYTDALLFAPDGTLLLAANDTSGPLNPATQRVISAALASRTAVFSDFFRQPDGTIQIDTAATLRDAAGQPLAVAILRSEAAAYLYPLIQKWPTPSRTAETFIVQREGDSILFLNEARHQANTALTLRQSLTKPESPGVQAVLGRQGAFDGVDYRGKQVLSDLRPIADSPWFMVTKVDADEVYAEVRARLVLVAGAVGALIALAGVATSSIHRQQNAAAISRLNAYNRSLLEASLDPLLTISPAGKITDVNAAAEVVTGRTRDQLMGTDFSDYFTEPDKARAGYQQVFREGMVRDYPLELRSPKGNSVPVLYNATVYRDPAGKVIGVFAAARDITERKRAEEALRESLTLRAEAEKLGKVGGWELNFATNALTWTEMVYHIHEVDLDYVPSVAEGINFYAPESRPVIARAVQRAIEQGEPFDVELEIITAKGNRRTVHAVGRPDVPHRKLLGFFQDITERKRAEEEIRTLNASLEKRVIERTAELTAANMELDSFSYTVSHDLRAPLRAMSGFSQALIEDYGEVLQGEAREYLHQITVASQHMANLVDGLLTLSRSTRSELRRDALDLTALCERIRRELAQAEPDRLVEWRIEPNLTARGDAGMIQVVLANLLGNAWKYTAGQSAALIRVHREQIDGKPFFCVTDNGAGFDMKHAENLFKPFQRLHRQDEFPGIGIGLATAQRILHRHGGTIRATAAVGLGASFRFSLPETDDNQKDTS